MVSRLRASGRSGLSNSRPTYASVFARLILLTIVSGLSSRFKRLPSASADLLILLEPSCARRRAARRWAAAKGVLYPHLRADPPGCGTTQSSKPTVPASSFACKLGRHR